ncbi:hypothetical protein OS493_017571 [Desmophyllum pertusum]|uniref:RRM domain-containing protein n=1 Tax=Desmophyllum pertusum TaxID=174260 RepID=A0A9W9ZSK5_9CNID|nr:hypothetical protein OS493_017571 [Desmophyllum pertusum]
MVKGLSEKTTSDGLRDYMEVVSGVDVLAVEFGEQGRALVTFNETYVVNNVLQRDKHTLDGAILNVTASNATCGLSEKTRHKNHVPSRSLDLPRKQLKMPIANFFETKRRSGGRRSRTRRPYA